MELQAINAKNITTYTFDNIATKFKEFLGNNYTLGYIVTFDTQNAGACPAQVFLSSGGKVTRPETPSKIDNVFVDWYTEPTYVNKYDFNTVVENNFTLYAKYDDARLITINKDENVSSVLVTTSSGYNVQSGESVALNDTITITATPKAGYDVALTVNGNAFTNGGTHKVTDRVVINATSAKKTYTLTYSTGDNYSIKVTKGTDTTALANNSTINYGDNLTVDITTSVGYYATWKVVNGTETINNATSVTVAGNVEITVTPRIIQNSVIYNATANGGSTTITTKTVNYGVAVDLTPTAVKTGYTFVGWNTNKDAKEKLTSLTMGTSDITLYAIYSKTTIYNFYQLDKTNDSKSVTIYNNKPNGTITAPTLDTVSGLAIVGWGESATATTISLTSGQSNITATSDKTYYAVYNYTVTIKYNGNNSTSGSVDNSTGIAYRTGNPTASSGYNVTNANITLRVNGFARTGYTFSKWAEGSTGGTQYSVGATRSLASNVTEYAVWNIETYTLTYTLDGGTLFTSNPATYTVNTSTFTLNNPTKAGYTFSGWTGSNGSTAQTTVTIAKGSTGNKTYTANWTATSYTLSYTSSNATVTVKNGSGTTVSNNGTISYGDMLTITVTPSTGYDVSWVVKNNTTSINNASSISVAGNVTITVTSTKKTYTLSVNTTNATVTVKNGSTTLSSGSTITYGDALTISVTANTGYNASWTVKNNTTTTSNATSVTVAGNVVVTVTSTLKTYTLSYTESNCTISVMKNGSTGGTSAGTGVISHYDTLKIVVTPNTGYEVTSVKVNSTEITNGSTYVVTGNVTITATILKTYTVTITQGDNISSVTVTTASGDLIASGELVPVNAVLTIAVTPASGCTASWTVTNDNTIIVGSPTSVTVSGNVTITVTGVEPPPYTFGQISDSTSAFNGYYYVDMGYYPQTKSSDVTTSVLTDTYKTTTTYTIKSTAYNVYKYNNKQYIIYSSNVYEVEPVRWLILGYGDNTAISDDDISVSNGSLILNDTSKGVLVLSEKVLTQAQFHSSTVNNWGTSDIYTFMNGVLLNDLFKNGGDYYLNTMKLTTTWCDNARSVQIDQERESRLFLLSYTQTTDTSWSTSLLGLGDDSYQVQQNLKIGSKTSNAIYGSGYDVLKAQATDLGYATGCRFYDNYTYWWLRAGYYETYNKVGLIKNDGSVTGGAVTASSGGLCAAFVLKVA